jgi:hypothetical protein
MPTRRKDKTEKGYKRRTYAAILHAIQGQHGSSPMRVEVRWSAVNWENVWKNLCMAPVSEKARVHWYKVIHELEPTNERLQKIGIAQTDECKKCHRRDTLMHRLIDCGEGKVIWGYARNKKAQILRTEPGKIPEEWLLHPQVVIWPPKRNRAILWILAQVIHFRTQTQGKLTLPDFMRLKRWKLLSTAKATEKVGNYLIVIVE